MAKSRDIAVLILGAGLVLMLVNTYVAPFYSNQNTYFLHGLAAAGRGELARDWMTAHADTFPLFTYLITAIYWLGRPVGDAMALILYLLSCGIYAVSIVAICLRLFPALASPRLLWPFLAILAIFHSTALAQLTGGLTAIPAKGVAHFYPLGGVFQPQAFGVLLLAGMAAFMWGRTLAGAALVAAACILHPAYLACGGFVVLGMLIAEWRKGTPLLKILASGSLALAIVLPMLIYIGLTYASADPELTRQAHEILGVFRSKHHTVLSAWFWDPVWGIRPDVVVKFSLCVAAMVLVRRSPLAWVLGASLGGMWALTLAYGITGNLSIAVAYPWRGFALIVPLSTAVILAWALSRRQLPAPAAARGEAKDTPEQQAAFPPLRSFFAVSSVSQPNRTEPADRNPSAAFAGLRRMAGPWLPILAGLVFVGTFLSIKTHLHRFDRTGGVQDFVRANVGPKDLYFVPSSDLTMMSFRLETGAPLFVDLKSHPVTVDGLLEWYRRMQLAVPVHDREHRLNCPALKTLLAAEPGITHVVSADHERPCAEEVSGLHSTYEDDHYSVWKRGGATAERQAPANSTPE